MESTKYTDVLIVGAGPSGLMMAAQLLRYGIMPTIIDAKGGPERTTKAITLQARSLEFLQQMGLADDLIANGFPCHGVQVQALNRPLGKLDLKLLNDPGSAFPFALIAGQDRTERLLIGRLTENTCPVAWETRLVDIRHDDQGATVTLANGGGIRHWRCKWVVGADGVASTVRQRLGIRFDGRRQSDQFFLADVAISDAHQRNIHIFLSKRDILAIFPLDEKGHFRLVGKLPGNWTDKEGLRYAHVKSVVDGALGAELAVDRCTWISTVRVQQGLAEQLASQRCFLIGDAAHVYSPIGGQGMNLGLQDAVNLAWKLAHVINGYVHPRLLQTYQQERMPVARETTRMANSVFGWAISQPQVLKPLRNKLLGALLRHIGAKPERLRTAFKKVSQLHTGYRKAALSVHHAVNRRVRAGDRLPFLSVFDEKAKTQTDLHRWCEKPGFALLVLGTISHHHLHIIGQWMRQKYPRGMHLYYLPYSPRNQQVFEVFEVNAHGTKSVLIRPDMYIGYINDQLNVSLIDTYMEEIIGWDFFGHLPEKT